MKIAHALLLCLIVSKSGWAFRCDDISNGYPELQESSNGLVISEHALNQHVTSSFYRKDVLKKGGDMSD